MWGQFVDHDIGLRDQTPGESVPIPFDPHDPLEAFANELEAMGFSRTPAATGTGLTTARQQIDTVSSYLDGSVVYGIDPARLEWLREGPVDGDLANNAASLLLLGSYLPNRHTAGSTTPQVAHHRRVPGQAPLEVVSHQPSSRSDRPSPRPRSCYAPPAW